MRFRKEREISYHVLTVRSVLIYDWSNVNQLHENEVVLIKSAVGRPIIIDISADSKILEQCKFMASIFNVSLIRLNKEEG